MISGLPEACIAPARPLNYGRQKSPWLRRIARLVRTVLLLIVVGVLAIAAGYWADQHQLWGVNSARRAEIRYQVSNNLDLADVARANCNWANARISVDRARLAASTNPEIFCLLELRLFVWRIDRAEVRLTSAQEDLIRRMPGTGDVEACIIASDHPDGFRIRCSAMRTAMIAGDFIDAAALADGILEIEPDNIEAAAVQEICVNGIGIRPAT